MTREVSNVVGYGLLTVAIVGFGLMVVGFGRFFAQAWRSPDRKTRLKRVLNLQPRKDKEWPNGTREADLIAAGAFCGVVFFGSLLVVTFFRARC